MKRFWFCAIPALLLLCGIGYFEVFGLPAGFPADFLRYALLGVSAVLILLIFLLGIRQNFRAREGKNIFGAICSALLAIGIILRGIYNIYSLFLRKSTDAFGTLFENRPAWGLIEPVLGLFAAFIFFAIAGSELFGLNAFEKAPALAAIPPVWYCCGVVLHFVSKIATASTAENSVEVLAVVFTLLFLFYQARLFARTESSRAPLRMLQCGVIALVFLIASTLQYAAELHFTGATHSSFEIPTHLLNALFVLYILSHLIVLRRTGNGAEDEAEAAEKPAAEAASKPGKR